MFSLFKTVSAEVETLANLEIIKIILFRIRIIKASVIKMNCNGIDYQKHNGQTPQNQSSNSKRFESYVEKISSRKHLPRK